MAATDYNPILGGSTPPNASALLEALEKRSIYVVGSSENPAALNPGFVQYLAFNGIIFWYDATDATTAHDGVTCIVTADGKRYKSDQFSGVNSRWIPVLDKDLTAPPGSPALNDAYLVAAGGTGDWATKDKNYAVWTARGWAFIIPRAFDVAYVRDEAQLYHYSAGGAWTSGLPALTIADLSVSLKKLKYFPLGVAAENQTTDAPPGSPSDGDAYIVGGSPSGAWIGHSLELAIWETSQWVYYTPYEGAQVYDKALNLSVKFNGATWESATSGYAVVALSSLLAGPVAITAVYNFSSTAPTTSNMDLIHSVNYTPKRSGAVLEISAFIGDVQFDTNSLIAGEFGYQRTAFGIFIDSVVNAEDWSSGPTGTFPNGNATQNFNFNGSFFYTTTGTTEIAIKLYGSTVKVQITGGFSIDVAVERIRLVVRELS